MQSANLKLVHRLDKDTSGVLLLANGQSVAAAAAAVLKHSTNSFNHFEGLFNFDEMDKVANVRKVYFGICKGNPNRPTPLKTSILIRDSITYKDKKARNKTVKLRAATVMKLLCSSPENDYHLFELVPITGRKHQLRIHLNSLGTPLLGDDFRKHAGATYSKNLIDIETGNRGFKQFYLHCAEMRISLQGDDFKFQAPLPDYFLRILKSYFKNEDVKFMSQYSGNICE